MSLVWGQVLSDCRK